MLMHLEARCVFGLMQDIEADWEDYNFIVCATDDEHVVSDA